MKTLLLIPTLLAEDSPIADNFPAGQLLAVSGVRHFFVENEKSARRFLKQIYPTIDFSQIALCCIGKHADEFDIQRFFDHYPAAQQFGVLSEAGYPCIADPGNSVVRYAHKMGMRVQPLIGPCSIFMVLAASGLNGQNFSFEGYLPIDKATCRAQLLNWQKQILQSGKSFLFIETPFRNVSTFNLLLQTLQPQLQLCVGCELTSPQAWISTRSIAHWRDSDASAIASFHKKNCIFVLGLHA